MYPTGSYRMSHTVNRLPISMDEPVLPKYQCPTYKLSELKKLIFTYNFSHWLMLLNWYRHCLDNTQFLYFYVMVFNLTVEIHLQAKKLENRLRVIMLFQL